MPFTPFPNWRPQGESNPCPHADNVACNASTLWSHWWIRVGLEPTSSECKSEILPFNYLPIWRFGMASTHQPPVLQTGALPVELPKQKVLLEQNAGIEPASWPWHGHVLPLHQFCMVDSTGVEPARLSRLFYQASRLRNSGKAVT